MVELIPKLVKRNHKSRLKEFIPANCFSFIKKVTRQCLISPIMKFYDWTIIDIQVVIVLLR